jgi:hypothetical protein
MAASGSNLAVVKTNGETSVFVLSLTYVTTRTVTLLGAFTDRTAAFAAASADYRKFRRSDRKDQINIIDGTEGSTLIVVAMQNRRIREYRIQRFTVRGGEKGAIVSGFG